MKSIVSEFEPQNKGLQRDLQELLEAISRKPCFEKIQSGSRK